MSFSEDCEADDFAIAVGKCSCEALVLLVGLDAQLRAQCDEI
jgi:hypothetical protein